MWTDQSDRTVGHGSTVRRVFLQSPLWLFAAIVVAPNALVYSVKPAPFADRFVGIARDPWNPPNLDDFFVNSPLSPLVAHHLGLTSGRAYVLLGLVLVVGLTLCAGYLVRRWRGDLAARLILVAWAASPLIVVELTWLGMYDPWTVFAATILTMGPRWAVGLGAILVGFNHFEQGIFIIFAALVVRFLAERDARELARVAGVALAFVAIGRLLQVLYLDSIHATASRVTYLGDRGVDRYVRAWRGHVVAILFSVYGVLWLPLAAMLRRLDTRSRATILALHCGLTIPVPVVLDTTRVYALITWPIIVGGAVWWSKHDDDVDVVRWAIVLFVCALVVPRLVVWDGSAYTSGWGTFLEDWRSLP